MSLNGKESFEVVLRERAEGKRVEYNNLLQEQRRLSVRIQRVKEYLDKVNGLLEMEGLPRIRLSDARATTKVGRPGNRAEGMPVRRMEWEGMSLVDVVLQILSETVEASHADTVVHRIYEIETDADKRKAKPSVVSSLRTVAKKGLIEKVGRNRFQRRMPQRELRPAK